MGASIWTPTVLPTANTDGTFIPQVFDATAAQTLFNLSAFSYEPGTHSLLVYKNGLVLELGVNFTETSRTSFTLTSPAALHDNILAQGFIGGTAAVAAETSAAAALASQVAAAASVALTNADVVLTHADVVLTHADVVLTHADVIAAAAQAGLAQNYAQLANIMDYGGVSAVATLSNDYGSV